jgi:hypothetical protein
MSRSDSRTVAAKGSNRISGGTRLALAYCKSWTNKNTDEQSLLDEADQDVLGRAGI